MTDENNVQPVGRKRGRPKKGEPKPEKKERVAPDCEKRPLEYPHRIVVWGTEPVCHRFKRKGLAVLYDPSRGKHYILMPVTDDGGEIRWRYRWVVGARDPYRYEQIDLEPGMLPETITALRSIADALEQGLEWVGGATEAKKVEARVVAEVKAGLNESKVDEMLKKYKGVL